MNENKLTDKQERFCREYVIDSNGTQAAIRAGYSEKTAQEQSSRLLSNVIIQERIRELQEEIKERNKIQVDDVIKDILEIKQRCMQAKPVMKYDKETKDYEHVKELVKNELTGEMEYQGVYTFDSNAALKACELLGKHVGAFEKDNSQKNTLPTLQITVQTNKE